MERKSLKKLVAIIVILMIIVGVTGVARADSTSSFKTSLVSSTTTLKPGEEVTISVNVSEINMGTEGINTLEGTLAYDSSVFETVVSSNVQSYNNWTTTYNDESSSLNGKFLAVNLSSGVKTDTKIFSVTLKVKLGATANTTTVSFKDITSNDGTDLVNIGIKSVSLNIETEEKKENTTSKPTENAISSTNIDKTQSSTKLPYTGVSTVVVLLIVASIVAVIGLAIKNRTMKDVK